MREWLLEYLRCPQSGTPLRVEQAVWKGKDISRGMLMDAKGTYSYPIINGIPRIMKGVSDESDLRRVYADSFGYQWNTFKWTREVDRDEVFAISDQTPQSLAGSVVLDAGCGGGRVSRVLGEHCSRVIAFDLSNSVDRAVSHTRGLDNCQYVQADILSPPFARNVFDLVWSHGVLHHTRDTRAAFDALAPLVKPGGELQVVLFLKAWLPLRFTDAAIRTIIRQLPYGPAVRVCQAMGVLRHLPWASFWKRFFWFSLQPDADVRACCNFDWYMPRYHHEHTVGEVKGWFREAGFSGMEYINGWPYAPDSEKHTAPGRWRRARLGQLQGIVGRKPGMMRKASRADVMTRSSTQLEAVADGTCSPT
ncbi:MAG: methyltransferase domain-containing protein [Planctomycetes bacterium]|nr:methyltransferase domain-containing protein [Planctomycetota bacterium]